VSTLFFLGCWGRRRRPVRTRSEKAVSRKRFQCRGIGARELVSLFLQRCGSDSHACFLALNGFCAFASSSQASFLSIRSSTLEAQFAVSKGLFLGAFFLFQSPGSSG
ncbi:unnamed protein product, partial [Phaeothamnion confervicola]